MWRGKILLVIVALSLSLFLISSVYALGITPGRATFNFKAGDEKNVTFSIVNTEHKAMNVSVRVEGEWAQYVTLNQTEIAFNRTEEIKTLSYNVKFPSAGGFDGVKARIIAMEIPQVQEQGTSVNVKVAVEHQLYIITNATTKNLTQNATENATEIEKLNVTKIYVKNYTLGNIAKVEIEIFNPKTRKITGVYSTLSIYDSSKVLRSQFNSSVEDINPGDKSTLEAFWDTQGFELGNYSGSLVIYYDNKTEEQKLRIQLRENSIIIDLGEFKEAEEKPSATAVIEPKARNIVIAIVITALIIFAIVELIIYLYLRRKARKRESVNFLQKHK